SIRDRGSGLACTLAERACGGARIRHRTRGIRNGIARRAKSRAACKHRRGCACSVLQAVEVDRILFAQGVLIAFEAIDFRDSQVEGIGEADHLRPALQNQFKLRIAEPCGSNHEFWIKVTACYQAYPVIAIRTSNNGAI